MGRCAAARPWGHKGCAAHQVNPSDQLHGRKATAPAAWMQCPSLGPITLQLLPYHDKRPHRPRLPTWALECWRMLGICQAALLTGLRICRFGLIRSDAKSRAACRAYAHEFQVSNFNRLACWRSAMKGAHPLASACNRLPGTMVTAPGELRLAARRACRGACRGCACSGGAQPGGAKAL